MVHAIHCVHRDTGITRYIENTEDAQDTSYIRYTEDTEDTEDTSYIQ